MPRLTILAKQIVFALLLVAGLCAGILGATRHYVSQGFDREAQLSVTSCGEFANFYLKGEMDRLKQLAEMTSKRMVVAKGYKELEGPGLKTVAVDTMTQHEIDVAVFLDAHGKILATGAEDLTEAMVNVPMVQRGLQGAVQVGFEGNSDRFVMQAIAPVMDNNTVIGAAIVGVQLSNRFGVVDKLKGILGTEVTIFSGDTRVSTTLLKDGKRMVGTRMDNPKVLETVLAKGGQFLSSNIIAGKAYTTAYLPLHGSDGKISGMVFVGRSREAIEAALAAISNSILVASGVMATLAMVMAWLYARTLSKPMRRLAQAAQQIAQGDFDVDVSVKNRDEIGQAAQALGRIPQALKAMDQELETLVRNVEDGSFASRANADAFPGGFGRILKGGNTIAQAYTSVLDIFPNPFVVIDTTKKIRFINNAAITVTGVGSLEKAQSRTCDSLFGTEDCNTARCACMKTFQTGQLANGHTIARPAGGPAMDIDYTGVPLHNRQGQVTGVMEVVTDLTAVRQAQRRMTDTAHKATDIASRLSAAAEQLSAQVEEVSQGAESQRQLVDETATAMEQMNSTIVDVARNAGSAAKGLETSMTSAVDGRDVVSQAVEAIGHVNSEATQLRTNMLELGRKADDIGSIMSVISDIADQTNLLALNAAIEAARAGDAGRGFAVVADEVRKLAEKTMNATKEVGSAVTAIQDAARINVTATESAAAAVAKATELAGRSGGVLSAIVNQAHDNNSQVQSIAAAAEEQSSASEQINTSVEEVARIVRETADGMRESSKAVVELSEMSLQLNALIAELQA